MILAGTVVLRTSRITALRTEVLSPLIHSLFKSTWLAFWASHVDSSRGAEICEVPSMGALGPINKRLLLEESFCRGAEI
jgi:hypothetical protein